MGRDSSPEILPRVNKKNYAILELCLQRCTTTLQIRTQQLRAIKSELATSVPTFYPYPQAGKNLHSLLQFFHNNV